jgi:hypothetical protein
MKLPRITTLLAAAAMLAVGCQNEDLKINNETGSDSAGYLSLKGLNVECVVDHKPVDEDVANKHNQAATRGAEEVDINTFDCVITDATGENVITSFKYGQRPSEAITLDAGNYIFKMMSGEVPAAAWESPVYGLTEPFTIVRKQTTELTDLVCTLQNIQVSISYAADLRAALSDDTVANVSIANNSLTYVIDETRSGYFYAPNAQNDIEVVVVGKYTPEGKTEAQQIEMTATIKNVKAGQYSDIYFFIEYSGEGNINVGAEIDGWVVDEEIIFDFSVLLSEDVMVDDDYKPIISMPNYDIDTPLSLYASDFDDRGNCLKDIIVNVATSNEESTIASLVIDITSTNGAFIASLSEFNIPQSFDLCNAGSATSALKLMGYPVNNDLLGHSTAMFDLTAQMKLLKEFGGTHSFKITVRDDKGGVSEKTLQIVIEGGQSGPTLVWSGYDINTRYVVTDDLTVDLKLLIPSGIKSFTVQIISEVLTPSQLSGVGLCDVLDLCDPSKSYDSTNPDNTDTSEVATALTNFGFMPADGSGSWLNATEANLSITKFLGLLKITGAGSHDFAINIVDNDGNTLNKTLMLLTE